LLLASPGLSAGALLPPGTKLLAAADILLAPALAAASAAAAAAADDPDPEPEPEPEVLASLVPGLSAVHSWALWGGA
jgi:hypothetical protein